MDPGLRGGVAVLEGERGCVRPRLVRSGVMPLLGCGRRVDGQRLGALLLEGGRPDAVVVEDVHAAPGQGVSSSFVFGRLAGAVEGVAGGLGLTVGLAPPGAWKAAFRLPGGAAGKAQSVVMAERLVGLPLTEGEAEALLIGWFWLSRYLRR